jgi:radical SAM-linked protein
VERGTRIRVKFVKRGELKYISHLDLLRTMERAVRRSGLPIAYTEGFHPHAKIQFASALPVGVESTGELMDIELKEEFSASEVVQRLKEQLPKALAPHEGAVVPEGEGKLTSLVQGAGYLVRVEPVADLAGRVEAWLGKDTVLWPRQRKGKVRHLDLRKATTKLAACGTDQLELFLSFSPEATNVRPQEVILSLELEPLFVVRTAIFGEGVLLAPLKKGKN